MEQLIYSYRVGGAVLLSTPGFAAILLVEAVTESLSLLILLLLLGGRHGGVKKALRSPVFWVTAGISAGVLAFTIASVAAVNADYVVTGNCSLIAETSFGGIRIDLHSANVSLSTTSPIRVRVDGLGLPGVLIGWARLTDGRRALAIVYRSPGVYLVVEGEGSIFVASHPGVRKAYRVVTEVCRVHQER